MARDMTESLFVRRWKLFTAIGLAVVVGSYVGAHHARGLAPSPWSAADLPELPDRDDNAFFDLPRAPVLPEDLQALVDSDDEFTALIGRAWERRRRIAGHLQGTSESRIAIRSRPRFVEAQGLLEDGRAIPALAMWKTRSLSVLAGLAARDTPGALGEVESMWRQANDYARGCRSLVGCMVALELLRWSARSAEYTFGAALARADRERLAGTLERHELDQLSLEAAMVTEYEMARLGIETEGGLLFDAAHTESMARDYFEALHRCAGDPSLPLPPEIRPTEAPLWWAYNARGKRFLEVLMVAGLPDRIDDFRTKLRTLRDRRVRLVASLRAQDPGDDSDGDADSQR